MIFLCVGSREYQFNRLIKKMDELVSKGIIQDEVFGQIGQSDYEPKSFKFERFLSGEEFRKKRDEASIIVSHGGTGALIGALKAEKKVIAVPRLSKYKEHIDDHQLQVASVLAEGKLLLMVTEMEELSEALLRYKKADSSMKKYDKPSYVLELVNDFIKSI
ncbi:PssE/Cps14G family polysaccharide biosynthesis glycosyltransferase [Ruoffia tabacinasalis]|uniref:Glycosyl transferase family 28 C-terminal domain-containing protein n=1 Tax=Ruoffia tabacinasalis TaxID=87458 RepID=A0ABS0LK17_9LACT|nr:PssE/Cps14G family polysaccharide biosynthesis glycosyltransferase [Ruoffia tabacinasalis]MBG9978579.1 hypothetical protein [Ruoffia tabacinasalis]